MQEDYEARIGRTYFGRYKFVKFIRDGMALVYQAIDLKSNSENVAVKVFIKSDNLDLNERFNREIRIYRKIDRYSHCLAKYHDADMTGTPFDGWTKVKYLVTVWEGDKTVTDLVAEAAYISTRDLLQICVNIVKQLADPLDYLHRGKAQGFYTLENGERVRRIVHRDIKPSNIVFNIYEKSRENEATAHSYLEAIAQSYLNAQTVLIDFGIAKEFSVREYSSSLEDQTNIHNVLGTYNYMSPEQWDPEKGSVDGRSDEYGLALTIYYILSGGKSPFNPDFSKQPPGTQTKHPTRAWWHYEHTSRNRNALTPLHVYRKDISKPVWEVIKRAISVNQQDRYPTIGDFAKALEETLPPPDPAEGMDTSGTHVIMMPSYVYDKYVMPSPPPVSVVKPTPHDAVTPPVTKSDKPLANPEPAIPKPFWQRPMLWGGAMLAVLIIGMGIALPALTSSPNTPTPIPTTVAILLATRPTRTLEAEETTTATESPTLLPTQEPASPIPTQETPKIVPPTQTPVSPTATDTMPPAPTATDTALPTLTPLPTLTATFTSIPTVTATYTALPTLTPLPTLPPTPTPSPTSTATYTPFPTLTPSPTLPPTWTYTPSPTKVILRAVNVLVDDMYNAASGASFGCQTYITAYDEFVLLVADNANREVDKTGLLIHKDNTRVPAKLLSDLYEACRKENPASDSVILNSSHDTDIRKAETLLNNAKIALQAR